MGKRRIIIVCFLCGFGFVNAQNTDSLIALAKTDSARASLYNEIGLDVLYQDYEKGKEYFDQSLLFAEKTEDVFLKANAKSSIALYFMYKGQFDTSRVMNEALIPVVEELDSLYLLSMVYSNTGVCYQYLGDIKKATEFYLKSLGIDEQIGDSAGLAVSYGNIGDVFRIQNMRKKALEYYHKALKLDKEQGNERNYGIGLMDVGGIYKQEQQIDSMFLYYNEALEIFEGNKDLYGLGLSYNNLASVYKMQGDYETAIQYYQKAIDIYTESGNQSGIASALLNLSNLYVKDKKWGEAEKTVNKALKYVEGSGFMEARSILYGRLSTIHENLENYQLALTYYKEYVTLNDSLKNRENSRLVSELEAQYESEKKESEIALLDEQNQTKELALSKTRQAWALTAIMTLIVGVFAARFLSQRKKEQRLNQKLINQAAELKKLNDLKDQIFSILSHDLRSPIASLQMLLDMLFNQRMTAEKAKIYYDELQAHLGHTVNLMENLLDWSVSHLKEVEPEIQSLNLRELVEETEEVLHFSLKQKKISLTHDLEDERVLADMSMCKTIIRNLLTNAMKFTNPKGEIKVSARNHGTHTDIIISDNGVGMSPEKAAAIFSGDIESTPGTYKEKGTGLGLRIIKEFVEKNHGSLRLESAPNKGTTVYVALPAA